MQRKQATHAVNLYLAIDQKITYKESSGSSSSPSLRNSENSQTQLSSSYPNIQEPTDYQVPLISEAANEALTPLIEPMRVAKPASASNGNAQRIPTIRSGSIIEVL